jgi:hypothetical protein
MPVLEQRVHLWNKKNELCQLDIESDGIYLTRFRGEKEFLGDVDESLLLGLAQYFSSRYRAAQPTLAPDGACENCGSVGRVNRAGIEQCDACGYPSPTGKA